jgi:hypothetical protein
MPPETFLRMAEDRKMPKARDLIDNFNDNVKDAKWSAYGNPAPSSDRIREVNGRVEIRPRSGYSGAYSGYSSISTYDLTDSWAHVELVQPLRAADGAETHFLAENGSNSVSFRLEEGYLKCLQSVSGTFTVVEQVPYDTRSHRWLRLREKAGTFFWDASEDGSTWTPVFSKTTPVTLSSVTLKIQVGVTETVASPGTAIFDNFNVSDTSRSRRIEERRQSAREVRVQAADLAEMRPHPEHANNNDEVTTDRPFVGNYSKSLKHDSLGDPLPASYGSLLRALESRDPADFEEIQLGTSGTVVRLTNPQSGLAFDVAGPDPQEPTLPPAPRFDSEQTAHEMGELYWMALARDVPFASYGTDTLIAQAVASLNDELPGYGGPRPVTAQNVFRGIYPGELVGPYVSQFLLKGNVDPRKADGQGRDADEGYITYGAQVIDQRVIPPTPNKDYLTDFAEWLDVQNGEDTRGLDTFDTGRRFIYNLRTGASYVHFDQVLNAFYNAAWILLSEPLGNQLNSATGKPLVDPEFPKDQGNPYDPPGEALDSKTQSGFATFGPIHLLQVLGEVLGRSLRAVWWQKWGVHRRLRPEEFGGRIHNHLEEDRTYTIHASILDSLRTGALSSHFDSETTYLLPQAYSEGSPTHPAYGAGHATGAGACATILKAFFDESKAIENPVQAASDGLSLTAYTGADAAQMTVGGELNKLAGNIALFRDAAGVHWRSDYTESLPLGEAIAIRLLQEMTLGFNEDDAFFELTRFDGRKIRIFDGKVAPVD